MNYDADARNFAKMIKIVWQAYGRPEPDRDILRYWYNKLESWPLERVSGAFDRWIDSQKYLPTVSDITILCRPDMQLYARLPAPKVDISEVNAKMAKAVSVLTGKRNYRGWINNILDNPKNYPDISKRFALEAQNVEPDAK